MFIFYAWLVLSAIACAMYIVAFVFESRVPGRDVPIWKDQSKAFLPGEFGLALFLAVTVPSPLAWPSKYQWIAGFVVAAVAFVVLRKVTYKPADYTRNQWRSPSKLWHDIIICFVYAVVFVIWWLPFAKDVISEPSGHWGEILLSFAGLTVWIGGIVYDLMVKQVPNPKQHPDVWKPLWSKV